MLTIMLPDAPFLITLSLMQAGVPMPDPISAAQLTPVAVAQLQQPQAVLEAADLHLAQARQLDGPLRTFPQRQLRRPRLQQVLRCRTADVLNDTKCRTWHHGVR